MEIWKKIENNSDIKLEFTGWIVHRMNSSNRLSARYVYATQVGHLHLKALFVLETEILVCCNPIIFLTIVTTFWSKNLSLLYGFHFLLITASSKKRKKPDVKHLMILTHFSRGQFWKNRQGDEMSDNNAVYLVTVMVWGNVVSDCSRIEKKNMSRKQPHEKIVQRGEPSEIQRPR